MLYNTTPQFIHAMFVVLDEELYYIINMFDSWQVILLMEGKEHLIILLFDLLKYCET